MECTHPGYANGVCTGCSMACDHPAGVAEYVYSSVGNHKMNCSKCNINGKYSPHSIANGVCTDCGARVVYVDLESAPGTGGYLHSVGSDAWLLSWVDDANNSQLYSTVIPGNYADGVYWYYYFSDFTNYKSETTLIPADKNCMRVAEYDADSGLYEVVWYNYPHTHSFSSETGICAECLRACEHSWGGDSVCDTCGYTCLHSSHYNHKCYACGFQMEHTFNEYGECTGESCYVSCEHASLDANGVCTACGMQEIHVFVDVSGDISGVFVFGEKGCSATLYRVSDGYYTGALPILEESLYLSLGRPYPLSSAKTETFVCNGTYNAIRVTDKYVEGKYNIVIFKHPCAHIWDAGVCAVCQEHCAHASWNETYHCTSCGSECAHESYSSVTGNCNACGKPCTHEIFENGQCKACWYTCPQHQLDDRDFCTLCDVRQIYIVARNWSACYVKYQSAAIDATSLGNGVFQVVLSENASGLEFSCNGEYEWHKTETLELPGSDLNCYYVGSSNYDGWDTYTYGGKWGVYPCTHSWVDGICSGCGEECSHNWVDGTCTICEKVCQHFYIFGECWYCKDPCEHTSYKNGRCASCWIACPGHELDEYGFCTVCDMRQIYIFTRDWRSCRVVHTFTASNGEDLSKVDNGSIFMGLVPEAVESLHFIDYREFMNHLTVDLTLPESKSLNCFYVEDDGTLDEYDQYVYTGRWGAYPCVDHVYADQTGSCDLCGAACTHTGAEYSDITDATHTVKCVCGYEESDNHSFGENGICVCDYAAKAMVTDWNNIDRFIYYATLPEALEAAASWGGGGADLYPLADYNGDFTIPNNTYFYGEGFTFNGAVTNNGRIDNGTFNDEVVMNNSTSRIWDGTFNGKVKSTSANIQGGTFYGEVDNWGTISNGTFTGKVMNYSNCRIRCGLFTETSEVTNYGTIENGFTGTIFNGKVTNEENGDIQDGTFNGEVVNNYQINGGTFTENSAVTNTGTIFGGSFNGVVVNDWNIAGGTFKGKVINNEEITKYHSKVAIFNGEVVNNGHIYYGTFISKLTNNEAGVIKDHCDANRYTWGENFQYIPAGGTVTGDHNNTDEATCLKQAVCSFCGAYGETDQNSHDASCTISYTPTQDGKHTASRLCGLSFDEEHTLTYSTEEASGTITSDCDFCDYVVTFTLTIPAGEVYGNAVLPGYTCSNEAYTGELPVITIGGEEIKDFVPNAGDYEVVMTWGGQTVTGSYTIAKAEPAYTLRAANALTYNGQAQQLVTAGTTADGKLVYSLTENGAYTETIPTGTNADTYTVYYKVIGDANHNDSDVKSVEVTITKATYDMSSAKWDYTTAFDYDGLEHTVTVSGLPTGVTASGYTGNAAATVGEYTAKVILAYDQDNYNAPTMEYLNWSIVNNWEPAEFTFTALNSNYYRNTDFVVTAAEGYAISRTNTADGEWTSSLTESQETDKGSITFYLKNHATGAISLAKTLTYKLDKTNPTGKVEFVERTSWQEFVNGITFGLFYKTEITVKAEAADNLSGVEAIEYAASDKAMTLQEVKTIASWQTMPNSGVSVDLEDAKQFVYFVRITDKAGNVTYLSTDGAEYDTTAPVISGVENGKIYYTTQMVTVTEKNLDTLTLNGQAAQTTITLEGDQNAVFTILAKDKAGNETTVTVTMKTIASLSDSVEDLTVGNATSADKDEIQAVLDAVNEILKDDKIPAGEKADLEDIAEKAQQLLKAIDDAAKALDTEDIQKVEDKDKTNVKLDDKADLQRAKDALEDALSNENKGNYTPQEQAAIQQEIERLEKAIEAIEQTEAVIDAIEKLPSSVEPDLDEAEEKAIRDAKADFDKLTDHQKSLMDKDDQDKLEKLFDTLDDYKTIKGSGAKWEKGSGNSLQFTANGPFRKFKELRVDGKVVDPSNYTVKEGSTIVTLKASYLQSLSTGKHTIQFVYTDGETDGEDTFRIYNSGSNPSTSDSMDLVFFSSIMLTSLLCMAALMLFAFRKRDKYGRR